MHILVTGFEPFAGLAENPSAQVLSLLPPAIGRFDLVTAVLPVDTRRVREALCPLWAATPLAVVHLGLARERRHLCLERVALNLLDFQDPDNAGLRLEDTPIDPDGPFALPSRLPLRAIHAAWASAGLPSALSASAGTFLCNQAMYLSLRELPADRPTGFIHLPPDASLPLATQARALETALHLLAQTMGPDREGDPDTAAPV